MAKYRKPRLILPLLIISISLPVFAQSASNAAGRELHAAALYFQGTAPTIIIFEALRSGILPISAVYPLFGAELGANIAGQAKTLNLVQKAALMSVSAHPACITTPPRARTIYHPA
jgi:hypothetical protein